MSDNLQLPKGWAAKTLIELAEYHNGAAFKPKDWVEDGLPIIRIEQLNDPDSETDKFSGTLLPSNFVDTGNLIFSWSATLKVVIWAHGPGALNQHLYKVVPKAGIEKLFLLYLLDFNMDKLAGQSQGSTMRHVTRKELTRFRVAYPAEESFQQKIVSILRTIDQAIEKTEALIEKYQQIKAGLMHDLFTRGIGPDGKLRPTREQATDLYQETPIGWIPKDWGLDVVEKLLAPVANNLRSGPFGSALLKSELVEDGIPFLGIDNIYVERVEATFRRFVSQKKFLEWFRYAVRSRDVVITIMGTVGRSAVIPDGVDRALSSKHLWAMTFDQEKVVPELVCWQLNFASWVKSWFRRETQGGIMDAIQSKTLRKLRLPVPPLSEQEIIFNPYRAITERIEAEQKILAKFQREKSGLMHDLLTGAVQVKPDPPKATHA